MLFGSAACTVDGAFLDGKPCDDSGACAGGYFCQREACPDNPGYLCNVCRKAPPGDGGIDAGDDGADGLDGGDDVDAGDRPADCNQQPPACKTIPECEDTQPLCQDGSWVCETDWEPVEASCDGLDNDCDGDTDEELVCTLAGDGQAGFQDGQGTSARFNGPRGLLSYPGGGLVVVDSGNHALRRVLADGSVSTLAGTGSYGDHDGPALEATFNDPGGAATDGAGAIYIADRLNNRIRLLAGDTVTTFAGTGFADYLDGPLGEARFALPNSLAVASDGTIFVADTGNNCVRKIAGGQVSTFSGKCQVPGNQDGAAGDSRFNGPTDILLLSDDLLIVSDESSHTLRQLSADGSVVTLAGTGSAGFADGDPLAAQFRKPAGCTWDEAGAQILTADSGNNRVRSFTIGGQVATLLGAGMTGAANGPALQATFNQPSSLAFIEDGRLVIADTHNNLLRIVRP
ncbi:MAG TPA: hypothetical protein VM425_16075 [Myxococcota bacterium]|nr:hypothetical protein [Myxococcota bacterium]